MNPHPSAPTAAPQPSADASPAARASRGLLAAIAGVVSIVAAAGYAVFGTPAALRGTAALEAASAAAQPSPQMQIDAMVSQLEERMKRTPDDAKGWSMLGRSYNVLGRHAEAVVALKRVVELRPNDAQAFADLADATAMAAGRQLAGEPERLVQRALQLDPTNLKALALAGTIAFDRGDFAGAVRHWENAVATAEPGSELARNLTGGIAEARSRAGMGAGTGTGAGSGAGTAAAAADSASAAVAAAPAARVTGRVALAAALQGQAAPDDTLFVFARAVDGPRVPLAILRKQVKDLPLEFTLDDSLAMNPAMRLSTAAQVVVGARISKSGNAIAQPGDLQGFSAPVPVGTQGLAIEIGERVK